MGGGLRAWLEGHPRWLGAVFLFCLFMTFVYAPYDIFAKPLFQGVSRAEEVWFGVVLHGWAAKATEPLHWAIYAALAWGLWKERPWVAWAGALYAAQVAVGMLVWSLRRGGGPGTVVLGVAAFVLFGAIGVALWRARPRFAG